MNHTRYYIRAALLPSGIIILGTILYSIYDLSIGPGKTYKSEWLTAESVEFYLTGMVILHCGFLALLCSPIFLTQYPLVQRSPILTFLSWFLLPMSYLGYLLLLLCRSIYSQIDLQGACLFFLPLTLPFIICLIVTFIKYRNSAKRAVPVNPPSGS